MSKTNRRSFLHQSTSAGIGLWASGGQLASAPSSGNKASDRLRLLTLEGTPRERGLTHGRTLKEPIRQLVKLWKSDFEERYQFDADTFIQQFLRCTDYLPAIRKWTPDLLEEVNGLATGAAIDFETVLVFQLIDEYWLHGPGIAGEHCSALGIGKRKDQPCTIAQNMDLEGFRDGFQTVLHIKYPDSRREALVLTHAGLIGLNGLNNASIGVCCNTLKQLANCRDGLPVACVVRGLLQQETEAAAIDFLRRVKHASGQNYIVGGPNQVHDYECSAGKVSRFTPDAGFDGVWHTNHPLANDDYSPAHREAQTKKKGIDNSSARLQSLQKRLGKDTAPSIDAIKAALAARDVANHPVCRPYKNRKDNFTFASTVMMLSGKPALHVAAGPPDVHAYQTLFFSGS